MENSKIEWCDHTFNPWEGCTKVSPGCANCYAEARDKRFNGGVHWGKGVRRRTSAKTWEQPLKWNEEAGRELNAIARCVGCGYLSDDPRSLSGCKGYCQDRSGKSCNALPCPKCKKVHYWCGAFVPARRPRVFCASLGDWLDDEVPIEWLADLLQLIHDTPNLDWLLLTKRPENWYRRVSLVEGELAESWIDCIDMPERGDIPSNIWIGTTVEDQTRADERIPALLKIPAKVRFLSVEPLLGPVDLERPMPGPDLDQGGGNMICQPWYIQSGIDWVICGGESGHGARPMHPDWARSLRDQCAAVGVPFFFKQWGEYVPAGQADAITLGCDFDGRKIDIGSALRTGQAIDMGGHWTYRVGKKTAGRLLDGVEYSEFPKVEGGVA